MKFGLKQTTVDAINEVLARHPEVERAILYGSRAKGSHKNRSDIDLTLTGGPELTQGVLRRIMLDLDDLPAPHTIDLSVLDDISDAEETDHIRRVGITFYEKPQE